MYRGHFSVLRCAANAHEPQQADKGISTRFAYPRSECIAATNEAQVFPELEQRPRS
jgi:hypothetical protein